MRVSRAESSDAGVQSAMRTRGSCYDDISLGSISDISNESIPRRSKKLMPKMAAEHIGNRHSCAQGQEIPDMTQDLAESVGVEWRTVSNPRLPRRLQLATWGSRICHLVGMSCLVTFLLIEDTSLRRSFENKEWWYGVFWILLHLLSLGLYFWCPYNPGYLRRSDDVTTMEIKKTPGRVGKEGFVVVSAPTTTEQNSYHNNANVEGATLPGKGCGDEFANAEEGNKNETEEQVVEDVEVGVLGVARAGGGKGGLDVRVEILGRDTTNKMFVEYQRASGEREKSPRLDEGETEVSCSELSGGSDVDLSEGSASVELQAEGDSCVKGGGDPASEGERQRRGAPWGLKNVKNENTAIEMLPIQHAETIGCKSLDYNTVSPADKSNYCCYCNILQPLRSRHCRECNRCVLTFDHHCFYIGGCVGEFNHWRFYLFLVVQIIVLLWDTTVAWTGFRAQYYVTSWISRNIAVVFVWSITSMILVAMTLLLAFHTYLILTNQTTWEQIRRKRIPYLRNYPSTVHPFAHGTGLRGMWENAKDFFKRRGPPGRLWEFTWSYGESVPFNYFDNDYYDCGC